MLIVISEHDPEGRNM